MSNLISVDKKFASVAKVAEALEYWKGVGRTVRVAKVSTPAADGSVTANMDFLVNKGDRALAFGPNYKINSVRRYDFNSKTFLAKGKSFKTVTSVVVS